MESVHDSILLMKMQRKCITMYSYTCITKCMYKCITILSNYNANVKRT